MKCKVTAGTIVIEDGVRKSESIFPVDRADENDIFVVAALPRMMDQLRRHPPYNEMSFDELIAAAIGAMVQAQGDPVTEEHTQDLITEYYNQHGMGDES